MPFVSEHAPLSLSLSGLSGPLLSFSHATVSAEGDMQGCSLQTHCATLCVTCALTKGRTAKESSKSRVAWQHGGMEAPGLGSITLSYKAEPAAPRLIQLMKAERLGTLGSESERNFKISSFTQAFLHIF